MTPNHTNPVGDAILDEVRAGYSHHYNVSEVLITISQSKAQLCIMEWIGRRSNWQPPATLLASTVLTLVSSQFHDVWLIKAVAWAATFWILAAVSLCLLIRDLTKSKRRGSITHLIEDIKGTSPQ